MSCEVVAHELDCRDVDRGAAVVVPAAERAQRTGDRGSVLHEREVADRLVDVGEQGRDEAGRRRRLLDGVGDERQRPAAERATDERRCQVEDPVAEAVLGRRGAVVRLVGVEDVQLAGQADAT